MNWSDKSFLLSKYKYQENSVIANFYTMNYGKRSGIIYGATSKKIKNYLQNGNEFWELELLKLIGFDLKIKDYCKKEKVNNKDNYYISKNNIKLIVPDFLINLTKDEITDKDVYYSLLLISEYMKTNILIPNNIPFPISREIFINEFK